MKLNVSVSGVHQFLDFSTGAQTNTLVLMIAGEEVHVECSEETLARWIKRSRGIAVEAPLPQPRQRPAAPAVPVREEATLTADDIDLEPDDLSDPFQPDVHAPMPMFDELPESVTATIEAYNPVQDARTRLEALRAGAMAPVQPTQQQQVAPRAAIPSPIDQPRRAPTPQPADQDDLFGSQG